MGSGDEKTGSGEGSASGAGEVRVRKATGEDIAALAQSMAGAFQDDPVMAWCFPEPEERAAILPEMFTLVGRAYLIDDEVLTTDELLGGAMCIPPESEVDEAAVAEGIAGTVGVHIDRVSVLLETLEEEHPEEPHYYLDVIGARPASQSRGIGSALLAEIARHCDAAGIPAYLEATGERNRRLYLRYGFTDMGDVTVPGGGPTVRQMWRTPRPVA